MQIKPGNKSLRHIYGDTTINLIDCHILASWYGEKHISPTCLI